MLFDTLSVAVMQTSTLSPSIANIFNFKAKKRGFVPLSQIVNNRLRLRRVVTSPSS